MLDTKRERTCLERLMISDWQEMALHRSVLSSNPAMSDRLRLAHLCNSTDSKRRHRPDAVAVFVSLLHLIF